MDARAGSKPSAASYHRRDGNDDAKRPTVNV